MRRRLKEFHVLRRHLEVHVGTLSIDRRGFVVVRVALVESDGGLQHDEYVVPPALMREITSAI